MHWTRQRKRMRWWIIKYITKRLASKKTKRTWELYSYLELPAFKLHLSDKRKIRSLNILKDESFSLDGTDKICVSRLPAYVSLPPSAVRVHFGLSVIVYWCTIFSSYLSVVFELAMKSVFGLFILFSSLDLSQGMWTCVSFKGALSNRIVNVVTRNLTQF